MYLWFLYSVLPSFIHTRESLRRPFLTPGVLFQSDSYPLLFFTTAESAKNNDKHRAIFLGAAQTGHAAVSQRISFSLHHIKENILNNFLTLLLCGLCILSSSSYCEIYEMSLSEITRSEDQLPRYELVDWQKLSIARGCLSNRNNIPLVATLLVMPGLLIANNGRKYYLSDVHHT